MKTLPNIQELIDYKAENRLNHDLNAMISAIQKMEVLNVNASDFPKMQYGEKQQLPRWFFESGKGTFYEALFNYWLPIYKNREAQDFIKRVEQLEENVNQLVNNQPEDY